MWMPRVNGQVEVDRGRIVWELIGRLRVEHAVEGVVRAGSWSRHR